MQVVKGTVVDGKVVFRDQALPEGTEVAVLAPHDAEVVYLPAHLQQELEEALDEAEREDGISAEELFAELRRYG